jgi:hypothetical protein
LIGVNEIPRQGLHDPNVPLEFCDDRTPTASHR